MYYLIWSLELFHDFIFKIHFVELKEKYVFKLMLILTTKLYETIG